MKALKSILGYSWAVIAFLVMLILFPSLNPLSEQVAKLPFMKINPIYQGGEKDHETLKGEYVITINKPVFESLVGEANKGFVQVKWEGKHPQTFCDTIDFDRDKKADFAVSFTHVEKEPVLHIFDKKVTGMDIWAKTEKGWIVRVGLKK